MIAWANGAVTGSACIGIASCYLFFGWLTDRLGWPGAFLVTSGITLTIAIVWWIVALDHPPRTVQSVAPKPIAPSTSGGFIAQTLPLLRDRSLVCLTFAYAALNYFEYLLFYWAEYYFESARGLSKEESRLNATALSLAMGLGMVVGGWLADKAARAFRARTGQAVVPAGGLLVCAVFTTIGAYAHDDGVILLCFAIAAAAAGSGEGAFWTASVRLGGARGGTSAAILNTGGNAGGMVGPAITPFVANHFGWPAALGLASVVCLVGAASWIGVRARASATIKTVSEETLDDDHAY
jgi:ACS family glucarate transporter-like MFS transporter